MDLAGAPFSPDAVRCRTIARKVGRAWTRDTETILRQRGYSGEFRWLYHSPEACLVWQVWQEAFPKALWVIVRRHDDEIIEACQKTGYLNRFRTTDEWQRWIDSHKALFGQLAMAGSDMVEIWPSPIFEGQIGELKKICDHKYSGVMWDAQAVAAYLRPIHWRRGVYETEEPSNVTARNG